MISAAYSDIGKKRLANEDSYFVSEFTKNIGYIIVADGMGGHRGGAVASKMTVDCIKSCFDKSFEWKNEGDIKNLLKNAIELANKTVYAAAKEDSHLLGMGTTVVLCIVENENLYIANVGDSRLYHITQDKINQVTKDHSVVQELIDLGEISEKEAENHPNKNLITRAVGTNADVETDFYKFKAKSGDMIVICTDGLSNMVGKDEIKSIVTSEIDLKDAVKKLVDRANERGGLDNITVAAVKF